MTGCLYIPTFEHHAHSNEKDFRTLVGDEKSSRPIRPYHIVRDQVVATLGLPRTITDDGLHLTYHLELQHGYWFWPLCFGGDTASGKLYGLVLNFDRFGLLQSYKLSLDFDDDDAVSAGIGIGQRYHNGTFFNFDEDFDRLPVSLPPLPGPEDAKSLTQP